MFSCFLGGALSTLSRVLAFPYLPVEVTDNSIVTDNKISSKVNTTDNNSVRSKTGSYPIFSITEKLHSVEIMRLLNAGQRELSQPRNAVVA